MKKLPIIVLISLAFIVGIGTNIFINSSGEPQITETESKSAMDLPFMIENGGKVSLNDIEFKEMLIINFWASWCEPCKKEIPELNSFNASLDKDKSTRLIGVAIDDMDEVISFMKEIPISYSNLTDEKNGFLLSRHFGNDKGVLPFTVVVDKNYQIRHKFYGEITEKDLLNVVK
jgi:thiol-disulfide isomerase/thioredoxin